MKLGICLLLTVCLFGAGPKKRKPVPRKPAIKKLELSDALKKELSGVLFGVSLNDKLELTFDMEAPTEDGASQLEKMAGVLAAAEQLKTAPGEAIAIDLPKATRVTRTGKVVRTTVSLTDEQLGRLLEARYGKKMVDEAKARIVYVHGLTGGTKSYPWGDGVTVDLRK